MTALVSDVDCTVNVDEVDTFEALVTPSSSTLSVSPAATVLPAVIVQISAVLVLTPQLPT